MASQPQPLSRDEIEKKAERIASDPSWGITGITARDRDTIYARAEVIRRINARTRTGGKRRRKRKTKRKLNVKKWF